MIILVVTCCKTGDLPVDPNRDKIFFGNGGGFGGIEKEYILHTDGTLLFKISRDTVYHHIATVDAEVTSQMFQNYTSLKIDEINLNDPGNMYCFLYSDLKGKKHKLVWNQSNPQHSNVDLFHNTLLSIVHKFKLENNE